jgi:hypothetical protein
VARTGKEWSRRPLPRVMAVRWRKVVDDGVVYSGSAAKWRCLGDWGHRGESTCAWGEREEARGDGARRRPVALRDVIVRVLARVGVSGRVGSRQFLAGGDVNLVKGMHGQLREGQGQSIDMVRGDGCERRGVSMVR